MEEQNEIRFRRKSTIAYISLFLPRPGSTGVTQLERPSISLICFLRRRTCFLITTLLCLPLIHGWQSQFEKGQWCLCPLELVRTPWFLQRVQQGLRSFLMFIDFSKEDSSIIWNRCLSSKQDASVVIFSPRWRPVIWKSWRHKQDKSCRAAPGTGICQSDCQSVSLKSKRRIWLAQTALFPCAARALLFSF